MNTSHDERNFELSSKLFPYFLPKVCLSLAADYTSFKYKLGFPVSSPVPFTLFLFFKYVFFFYFHSYIRVTMYICHMHVGIHRGHITVLDSWDLELQKAEGYPVRVLRTELRFSRRVANSFKLWAICPALPFDSLTTAILSVLRWKESQCNFNLHFYD